MIRSGPSSPLKDARNTLGSQSPLRALQRNSFSEGLSQTQSTFSKSTAGTSNLSNTVKLSDKSTTKISSMGPPGDNSVSKPISILSNKLDHSMRRNSYGQVGGWKGGWRIDFFQASCVYAVDGYVKVKRTINRDFLRTS